MPAFICTTCGTQYPESEAPPANCTICQEERQYVNPLGQSWTTLQAMRRTHVNGFRQYEPGLIGIGTTPAFAIGQRALLLRTAGGNVLWDCISFIDDATVEIVRALGGISAIAISHPHFYASMVAWSHAFGGVPIHLHADDRQWVMRPDPVVAFWEGETRELCPGVTLLRCGGHFAGGTVLHWADGAGGKGALLTGDIATVTPDRKAELHAELSEPDPAGRGLGAAHRRCAGGVAVRSDLRRMVGPDHCLGWQGGAEPVGEALPCRGQRTAGRSAHSELTPGMAVA